MHNDDVEIERLTKQQSHILEVMQNFPRLQIKGGAGTGKTVLAIKKAQMVEQNGGNVLFLCYNELLARKINSKIKKTCYDVSVFAFFNFCKEVLHISNEEYEKYRNDARLYSLVLPKMLKEYLDNHVLTYDAIIVDEGQDFTKAMWQVIELMVQPNGEFYIFYDPEQNIYCDTLTLPEFGLPPVELTKNCRNTRKIFDAMSEYCDANMEIMEGSPVGCDVRVLYGNCRELLEAELIRLHQVDNIPLCDIVVLGGHSLANTCIGADVQVGPYSICENSLQVVKDSVRYFTYMKFKGCEEKIIILLEADEKDPRWSKAGMYTAMSRAKHQLIILKNDSTVR